MVSPGRFLRTLCLALAASIVLYGGLSAGDAKRQAETDRPGHTGPVTSLAFSPDGSLLASGAGADGIRIWDSQTGKLRARYAS